MSKEELTCGFCGRTCEATEDVSFLTFPDGSSKPAHLSHKGVKEEWERQHPEEINQKKE